MRHQDLVLILTSYFLSHASVGSEDLPNFFRVNDKLARGGQPKDAGFAELKKLGFKTVIDLRDDDERARRGKKKSPKPPGCGLSIMPLANWNRPSIKKISMRSSLRSIFPDNQPVFVHCRRGADRTGTVMAVYRIKHDGWNAKQASEEAEKFGIGWWQFPMRDFIQDYYRDTQSKTARTCQKK